MFATLLGALPRPPIAADASIDELVEAAVRAQVAAGLEPVTDGGLRPADDPVVAWRATSRLTDRAVKQALTGPYSAGHDVGAPAALRSADTLARATDLNAVLRALAAAGCPLIEIHEPAAVTIGADPAERALFRDAHDRLLDGVAGSHLSLAVTGGSADGAGVETLLAAPYASLAVDLIDGPDNWRLATTTPGDRGIVCGVVSVAADSYDGPEPLLWAAGYAASTRGPRTLPGRAGHGRLAGRPPVGGRGRPRWPGSARRRGSRRRRSGSALRPWIHAPSAAGPPRSDATHRRRRRTTNRVTRRLDTETRRCHHPPTSLSWDRDEPVRSPRRRRRFMSVSEHITFVVNGTPRELDVEPRRLLVQALREDLDLTGTHVGCDTSQCGACTVHVDGRAIKSCTMLAVQADGAEVLTIEGLADGDTLHPMQAAFWEKHGLQCGFCTPGMIMTAVDLLEHNPDPTDDEIRHAIEGNFCRCTGYQNIVAAIRHAAETIRSGAPVTA